MYELHEEAVVDCSTVSSFISHEQIFTFVSAHMELCCLLTFLFEIKIFTQYVLKPSMSASLYIIVLFFSLYIINIFY